MTNSLTQLGRLAFVLAVTWLSLAGPAYLVGGVSGVEGAACAAVVCLLPSIVVSLRSRYRQFAGGPVSGVIYGMAMRMAVVLMSAVALCVLRPGLQPGLFLILLAPFYFVTLVVETRHLLGVVDTGCEMPSAGLPS